MQAFIEVKDINAISRYLYKQTGFVCDRVACETGLEGAWYYILISCVSLGSTVLLYLDHQEENPAEFIAGKLSDEDKTMEMIFMFIDFASIRAYKKYPTRIADALK